VNVYQITKDEYFLEMAQKLWQSVEDYFVDHTHGEWFYEIDINAQPVLQRYKLSEWKGPYHNGRACLEILSRLKEKL